MARGFSLCQAMLSQTPSAYIAKSHKIYYGTKE